MVLEGSERMVEGKVPEKFGKFLRV